MEVILLERIEKLGQMGDVVNVKPGFARNYLLPQKKALRATKESLGQFETRRAQLEADNLKQKQEAESVGNKLDVRVTNVDSKTRRLGLSIKAREIAEEKEAVEQYGSSDSGASLGDILGAALKGDE